MSGGHVSDLVGHDGGEFSFAFRCSDQCAVDVEKSARKSVGAGNVAGVDDLYGEWNISIGVNDDSLGEAIDVLVDDGIMDDLGAVIEGRGHSFAEFMLALE